jgi:hypothetical protein
MMNTTPVEPLYVTSLDEIFWAGTLMAITMTMHGFGMLAVLRVDYAIKDRIGGKAGLIFGIFPLVIASWMIMFVHLIEVGVWAAFFIWQGAFANGSISYYFSLNEYTTVGSNFNLPVHWRLLEGMIATTGLLTFAWSTGILLTLAQEFQDQRMHLVKERSQGKSAPKAKAGI